MINYLVLRREIKRDPQELGYANMSPEDLLATLNDKRYFQSELDPNQRANLIYGATAPTVTDPGPGPIPLPTTATTQTKVALWGMNLLRQVKRSRAELLFGEDIIITMEDIQTALNS